MSELNLALEQTLQVALDKLVKGDPDGVIEIDTEQDEFEQWLKTTKTETTNEASTAPPCVYNGKEKEMEQAMRINQEDQRLLAQQVHEMQHQITRYTWRKLCRH